MARHTRIASLDGLRAVSIIFVLSWHLASTQSFSIHFALDGPLGVRVFFVISGFIITRLLVDEEQQRGTVSLAGFYRRRCVRILPVLWCYLAVLGLLGWAGAVPVDALHDLLPPLTFTNGLTHPPHSLWQTAHLWSLTIEEHFYLLWPGAFLLLGKGGRRLIALGVALVLGPAVRGWIFLHPTRSWLIGTIVMHFDMLGWGCFLAVAEQRFPMLVERTVNWRPAHGRLLAAVVIAAAPWYCWKAFSRVCPAISMLALSMSLQAMAIAYLIASFTRVQRGISFRLLNSRLAVRVGVWSYSIYLWQQLFLHPATAQTPWVWRWPFNLVCALVVAIASYHLVERPLFRLKGPRPEIVPRGDSLPAELGAPAP